MKNARKKNVNSSINVLKFIFNSTTIAMLSLIFTFYFSYITFRFDKTKKVIEISPILQTSLESYNKEIMYSIIENKNNKSKINGMQYENVLKLKSLLWAYIENAKAFSTKDKESYNKCNKSFDESWKLFNKYYSDSKVIDENDYNIFTELNLLKNCTNYNKDIIERNTN